MAHRFTRAPLTAVLAALIAAAPLGAQWQGVVTFHNQRDVSDHPVAQDFDYVQGPPGVAKMVIHDREQGPMSVIFSKSANTATVVMAKQQMYMTMPLSETQAEVQKHLAETKITATGKTDVVAGHQCTYYHVVNAADSTEGDACIASDMGTFAMFDAPARGGGGGGMSFWKQLFASRSGGFFPLKMTSTKNGKVQDTMEATSIQAKSVDASEFVVPSSFHAMTIPGRPN
ncbi:MAG TPA: DUF4412 domain-containing protein [Gemmatimonadaceae bacterium]|nr:DUF4412 domain-containing protein [Gemmatimonadaceae bacterium]